MAIFQTLRQREVAVNDRVDWSRYALHYDLLSALNPAYQDILTRIKSATARWRLAPGDLIVELGAGTGNVSTLLAELFPQCIVIHIEPDPAMNEIAANKALRLGLPNLTIQAADVSSLTFGAATLGAIVCVHSLYTFPNPHKAIASATQWLKDGGVLIACDVGRVLDVADWRRYMLRQLFSQVGVLKALWLLIRCREAIAQNHKIVVEQRAGRYWCHSLEQFRAALGASGLVVENAESCFRGYSDFVVCRKPATDRCGPQQTLTSRNVPASEVALQ